MCQNITHIDNCTRKHFHPLHSFVYAHYTWGSSQRYTHPRSKSPERPEIRYALSTHLYAPIRPLYTQSAHRDMHTPRPKRPEHSESWYALSTHFYAPRFIYLINNFLCKILRDEKLKEINEERQHDMTMQVKYHDIWSKWNESLRWSVCALT